MRQYIVPAGLALLLASTAACTDELALGNASLEGPTDSEITIDTVFSSAEYTRQMVVGIYSKQYYGLPYTNGGAYMPHAGNPYTGKLDGLTDCWHQFWNGAAVYGQYYTTAMTAYTSRPDGLDGPLYSYDKEFQWWGIRSCLIYLANEERTPGIPEEEKSRLRAEVRCLMVDYFFNTFMHYGGIPILDHALEVDETSQAFPRNTVEECVNWMVEQLDLAIAEPGFPWVTSDPTTMSGRWTRAGARALKCKILQFAASPLLNPKDGQPYYSNVSEELKPLIMYTDGKYQEHWDRFATACDDFFDDLKASGYYKLFTTDAQGSTEASVPAFRLAYRSGYFLRESPEVIHSVRVMGQDNGATARYCWHSWYSATVPRNAYCPTQEYVEKFPYFDGEPFNWDKAYNKTYKKAETSDKRDTMVFITNAKTGAITRNQKSLHTMFMRGTVPSGGRQQTAILTRDPRLYEECIVNGQQKNLDWTTASMSGYPWELWYNGADGGTGVFTQTNTMFGSGYGFNKYYLGTGVYSGDASADSYRYQTQWVTLSLADMYLTYAEALVNRSSKNVAKAVEMVDMVRSRVGLPTMAKVWTSKTNRDAIGYVATTAEAALAQTITLESGGETNEFMEELLDERVRELGLTNARWFDMIRYKRTEWMTKQLHGLFQRRMVQQGAKFAYRDRAWVGADRDNDASSTQPLDFESTVVEITGNKRVLWGADPKSDEVRKWLLSPFPQAEINKQLGVLLQNPGW